MMARLIAAFLLLSLCCEGSLRAQFHPPRMVVSYNGQSQYGRNNCDSVRRALLRLGIPYDTLDRATRGDTLIDYTAWDFVIWASGDPTVPVVPGEPAGQSGLSYKETQELKAFLQAGRTDAKRSLIMVGQNIAYQNGYLMPNGSSDTEFMHTWLHIDYVANSPTAGAYSGWIAGRQSAYWNSIDSLNCASPDIVKPSKVTPPVGPVVNALAYSFRKHALSPQDSGAGVTYNDNAINTIFFAFDWADPIQGPTGEWGQLTSGVTRVLKGALLFATSHGTLGGSASVGSDRVPFAGELGQCVPNPSNGHLKFSFTLTRPADVNLKLFDATGSEVALLASGHFESGEHEVTFDRGSLPAGVYFYRLEAGGKSLTRSLVIEP